MEKFGVVTNLDERTVKEGAQLAFDRADLSNKEVICVKCQSKVLVDGLLVKCPKCGTAPFER